MPLRALIVDDDLQLIDLLARFLRRYGLELYTAMSGGDAVAKAREIEPDFIFLDYLMPEMDGFRVLDILRGEESDSVIIMMTGHGSETIAAEAFRQGADDYLRKPFTAADIHTAMERAMREAQRKREKQDLIERLFLANATLSNQLRECPSSWSAPAIQPAKPWVFLSYSRTNWTEFVQPTVAPLQQAGFEVWVDQYVIAAGYNWMDEIGKALDVCQVMVLFLSPEAIASPFVKMEYRYFQMFQKPLLPIVCKPTNLPPELTGIHHLPSVPADLGQRLHLLLRRRKATATA